MKPRINNVTRFAFHIVAVAFSVALFGLPGLALAFFNPAGASNVFGTSYNKVNATTVTDLTTLTAKAREELWARRIVLGSDHLYQENPFADNMIGKPGSGKPIVSLTETEKVAGNTINIPTVAGFGGPGVSGEGDRIGAEQKIRIGNFPVQIGRYWFGMGFTSVARDETVVGGKLDEIINDGLRAQMAKKKSDDILMKMRATAGTSGRNYLLPDGIASRADLVSASVMSTSLITKGGLSLTSLGGKPLNTVKDASGSIASKYILLSSNIALSPLDTDTAYLEARINAGVRGTENNAFRGRYDDWLGHGIYRWEHIDHGNYGPVGSPLLPRAFLGVAITGATTNTLVKGGGNASAAAITPAPAYFEFFKNAPYTFFNGETIAADTSTTRHVIIINPDGSYGVFPYILNDGNKLTISAGAVSIGVGTETTNFVEGALIQECNIQGVPICYHSYMAADAVACGTGSINGSKTDPMYGKRTEEHRNHDMDHGIGIEAVWGCAAVKRADNIVPGFLIVETAAPISGAPIIT